jgi:phosphoribosylaminoimidazole-succinocarboxamide synthase
MSQIPQVQPLFESNLRSLKKIHQGKVRDIYDVDAGHLLIVTTDRLSAFDVIMREPIPHKGAVLTAVSLFWFEKTRHIVPNHLSALSLEDIITDPAELAQLRGRSMVVKKLKALPVEAVVRGYLIGSGWKDYQRDGAVCGVKLPSGLLLADRLPQLLFTPASKAPAGQHDENIDFATVEQTVGAAAAARMREVSLALYAFACEHALKRGIIIADTKFEFGLDAAGTLTLIDEALTPDSSRFWPVESYRPGISPPSFDKQFVRDYLESLHWDKRPPPPPLPAEIVRRTSENYQKGLALLTA